MNEEKEQDFQIMIDVLKDLLEDTQNIKDMLNKDKVALCSVETLNYIGKITIQEKAEE